MPEVITLSFKLNKDLWRQFLEAHYGCDASLKLRYLWGAICILIAALGFGGFYDNRIIAALLMTTGFFGVLSSSLLVAKSLRRAVRHPFYGAELEVEVGPQEIAVRSGSSGYRQPWGNFVGFRSLKPGFLLYHDRSAFFFIPRGALNDLQFRRLGQILAAAGVPELKRSVCRR